MYIIYFMFFNNEMYSYILFIIIEPNTWQCRFKYVIVQQTIMALLYIMAYGRIYRMQDVLISYY